MQFVGRLLRLWNKNGKVFLVLYTKECFRVCQAFIAGNLVNHSIGCPVSLVGGLPKIIPGSLRALMRRRDRGTFRAVLSIFQVYRVLSIPGRLRLESITDPFKGQSSTLPLFEIRRALEDLDFGKIRMVKPLKLLRSISAGPNSKIAL